MTPFSVKTSRRTELIDITRDVEQAVGRTGVRDGLAWVYIPHTTAGVTINEGADPSVQEDILGMLNHLVPFQRPYRHQEGNSAAHIKASLIGSSVTVAIENGKLVLGTWQSIFFGEFDGPRSRKVWVKVVGDRVWCEN